MRVSRFAALALLLLMQSPIVEADTSFEIKGIYVGMPQSAVWRIAQQTGNFRGLTIAGVPPAHNGHGVSFAFTDAKLVESFSFRFSALEYSAVRGAVLGKYPALKCTQSEVQNALGARFEQEECSGLDDSGTELLISRRSDSLTISQLTLISSSARNAASAKASSRAGDI